MLCVQHVKLLPSGQPVIFMFISQKILIWRSGSDKTMLRLTLAPLKKAQPLHYFEWDHSADVLWMTMQKPPAKS